MSDARAYVADLREEYVRKQASQAAGAFDRWVHGRDCESPIEQRFLAEALVRGWAFPDRHEWEGALRCFEKLSCEKALSSHLILSSEPGDLITQLPVRVEDRSFRLDFAFFIACPDEKRFQPIAVELDGHDFHERTKEQARRDRSRDRVLQRNGWLVARFTGSEIHKSVKGCWDELDELIYGLYLGRPVELKK